jgi:hypothetical protein
MKQEANTWTSRNASAYFRQEGKGNSQARHPIFWPSKKGELRNVNSENIGPPAFAWLIVMPRNRIKLKWANRLAVVLYVGGDGNHHKPILGTANSEYWHCLGVRSFLLEILRASMNRAFPFSDVLTLKDRTHGRAPQQRSSAD